MKPYPFCSLNHFTVPVAMGCPFTAGCMNAAPQRGRRLDCRSSGRGSLNVRPAVRREAAQSSGQRSMDEEYTPPRRCSTARRTAGPSGMVQSGLMLGRSRRPRRSSPRPRYPPPRSPALPGRSRVEAAPVPALRHGETVVTETAAICAYLADAFPEAGLAPPHGSQLRGPYYRWLFFAAGPLEAAITNKMFGFEVPAERQAMAGYGSYEAVLDALEQAVSGRAYLVGDSFTAADVYVASHLGWGMMFGSIERRPAFECYHEGFSSRPAVARAREIDDALMPAPAQSSAAA